MTRHPSLVKALEREGCHVYADCVRHGFIPGQVNATLAEIAQHAADHEMPKTAAIIRKHLDS